MKRYVVLALVVGFLVGADDPQKAKGKEGATALEGTWVVISITEGGKEDDGFKNAEMVFEGNTITIKTKQGDRKATFKIDPQKKTIDLVRAWVSAKEELAKGIYQLKGDELKVCHSRPGGDRPKDFMAGKGSGNTLIVLKRAKTK
jgi:uncharacterized protein (TIGR03067 family)